MLTNGKHESTPKKKSRFNFWSEHSPNTQVNDLSESEVSQDAGDNSTDSGFQKTLKKFKTSSLRLKKKLGFESVEESKTLQASSADDSYVQQSNCNQTAHIFSDQSLIFLEGLHHQKSVTLSSSTTTHHALLAGIGFLGNLSLFQTKSITLPELKSREYVKNNVKNYSLSNSEIQNVNENFGDVLSNEIERISPENSNDAAISQFISHKTSAINLQQDIPNSDCNPIETIQEAEHSITEESTSPESQNDGNIWKMRVEDVDGEERVSLDGPGEVDPLERVELEELGNAEMNGSRIVSIRCDHVAIACEGKGNDKNNACCIAG